jgi:hypothetical protein
MADDAAADLARRLKDLRVTGPAGAPVRQGQIAEAFGASVPLISSWERWQRPTIPPEGRLRDYSRFFATARSLAGGRPRLLGDDELTAEERGRRRALERELLGKRAAALGLSAHDPGSEFRNGLRASPGAQPWRFPAGEAVTIVSAKLPAAMLAQLPSADRFDPDFVESYRYADLDSVIELFGHLRAVNPDSPVTLKVPDGLLDDDRTQHLVLLGGVDWNSLVAEMYGRTGVPVRQISRPTVADHGGFRSLAGAPPPTWLPTFDGGRLTGDVGHFLRAPNPYNRERTLTIFNASYALGVYGMVRALTDARFRDRNAGYLQRRFAESETASILSHVRILAGSITVPDWNLAETRLHEWPEAVDDRSAA